MPARSAVQVPASDFAPLEWRAHLARTLVAECWPEAGGVLAAEAEVHAPLLAGRAGGQPALVVLCDTLARAERLAGDIEAWLKLLGRAVPVVLVPEATPGQRGPQPECESERSRVLDLALTGEGVFVAPVLAALAPAPAPRRFVESQLTLRRGEREWPPERLVPWLVGLDYDNEAEVHLPGEFSWRGGILDVFSPAQEYPVRLDYFGTELESLRLFDPETQRSLRPLDEARLIARGDGALAAEGEASACFLDYFAPARTLLAVCLPDLVGAHVDKYGAPAQQDGWRRLAELPLARVFLAAPEQALDYPGAPLAQPPLYALAEELRGTLPELEERWEEMQQQMLRTLLGRWVADGYRFLVCCASHDRRDRARALWRDTLGLADDRCAWELAELEHGLFAPAERLVVLTETELFGRTREAPPRRREPLFRTDHALQPGIELVAGDYVVHAAHGIAKFLGLRAETVQQQRQEVLALEFADEVKVFVPVDQAHLVTRYVGATRAVPKLSRIGGRAWKSAREDAEVAVNDLAAELIRIQAMRQAMPGFAFTAEPQSLAGFDEAFPYRETTDQLQAIAQVRRDMGRPRPMDRLLCGDVGFGKTEVAMRAAYQAVLAGKQVAVLVPTTVLCQQHFLTFRERFRAYPVLIESLSRFRSDHEQRLVLAAAAEGRVDILIGTHRLLSGDVRFKDLGLVIVDEEQRFGVRHKERLKQLRANVDVLTMTATPIPRTLYMAMSGLRDMSTIVTPPQERLPVHTVVTQYDDALIREAILREIERDGQVYLLHNRVQTIAKFAEHMRRVVPEASFDIGHGQMAEHELEPAMLRFIEGRTQVLVCTTIIESGLDIPNANTIIIDRADRFGLAELYQLRGRVGRYHHQAYAYLLIPPKSLLLDNARERLAAIRKYTQLGTGFKLALRDLEIRGTGNILGAEQSGHITAIGFSLYCDLLKEAVARMRQEPLPRLARVSLVLPFVVLGESDRPDCLGACFPRDYARDEDVRVELYRRLSAIVTEPALEAFAVELADRFGRQPPEVEHLLLVTRLRVVAAAAGIHSIAARDDKLLLETAAGLLKVDRSQLPRLVSRDPRLRLEEVLGWVRRLAPRKPPPPPPGRA